MIVLICALSVWALGTIGSIFIFFRSSGATPLRRFLLIVFWLVMALPILFLAQQDYTARSVITVMSQWAVFLAIIAVGFGLRMLGERR